MCATSKSRDPRPPKRANGEGISRRGWALPVRQGLQSAERPGRRPPGSWRMLPRLSVARHSFLFPCPRRELDRIRPPREARLEPGTGALPVARRDEELLLGHEAKRSTMAHVPRAGSSKASPANTFECRPLTGGRPDSMLHSNALRPRYSAERRGPAAPFPGANHEPLGTPARPCLSPPCPPSRPSSAPEWWGRCRSSSSVTFGGSSGVGL